MDPIGQLYKLVKTREEASVKIRPYTNSGPVTPFMIVKSAPKGLLEEFTGSNKNVKVKYKTYIKNGKRYVKLMKP